MFVYILLILFVISLYYCKYIDKNKYCFILFLLLTCIVGFRSIDMGMKDTNNIYLPIFNDLSKLSIPDAFNYLRIRNIEPGFYIITRLIALLTRNFRLYLIIFAIPINLCVSRFIYKYSKNPVISYLMYISLNYFAFSFTLLRHCCALAITLLAFEYIKEHKIKASITTFFSGLFHRSSWIYFISLIGNKIKFGWKNIIMIFLAYLFSFSIGKQVYLFFARTFLKGKYSMYSNPMPGTLTFFIINLCILFFVIIITSIDFTKTRKKKSLILVDSKFVEDDTNNLMLNLYSIGIVFASFVMIISESFRISSFFTIYSIVLLPNSLKAIEDKKVRVFLEITISIVLILYFFLFTVTNNKIYPYKFFF